LDPAPAATRADCPWFEGGEWAFKFYANHSKNRCISLERVPLPFSNQRMEWEEREHVDAMVRLSITTI